MNVINFVKNYFIIITFNKVNTYDFFGKRVYRLEDDKDFTVAKPGDEAAICDAVKRGREWGDKIPIGLFYQEERATYGDEEPGFSGGGRPVDVASAPVDIEELKSKFM